MSGGTPPTTAPTHVFISDFGFSDVYAPAYKAMLPTAKADATGSKTASADAPAPLAVSQVACAGALGLVSLQVARASPFDVDDPVHVALSHVALDAVALAEVAACLGFGAPSASTFLVAWTLGLLWLCNAAQIHELQAGGRSSSEDDDAPPAKSDGAISFSV